MADYYAVLMRAVTAPDAGDAAWRRGVYENTRAMLAKHMRARRPPPSLAEAAAEQAALEGAIERVEAEVRRAGADAIDADIATPVHAGRERPRQPPPATSLPGAMAWIAVVVIVAALGAAGLVFWPRTVPKPATPPAAPAASAPAGPVASAPASPAATAAAPQAPAIPAGAVAKDGDLAPGVDGGSTDDNLPYPLRRQPTFYRTLQPVGTVIIDKLQHFLYLIRPNNVALRYGIGVGSDCAELAGLARISSKAEWPQWQPPAEMIARKLAKPGILPGGPGNPLGARILQLGDAKSFISGTNAPRTIGTSVTFGCIRLVNDDIVDLYGRVQVATPVILN
jgi:lipoprotein-anchoring transpeptidase ErfK/SrfK